MQNFIYGSFEGRRIGFANRRRGACLLFGRRAARTRSATKRANPFWMKSEGGTGRQPLKGRSPLRPLLRNRAIPTNTYPKQERTLVRDQWRLSPKRSYSPKAFAKSVAGGSNHEFLLVSGLHSMARCENQLSGAAPCQWTTLGAISTTSPGLSIWAGLPFSW